MNVSLKSFMPVAAAGLLGLSACGGVTERARDYMQDRLYSEFKELTNTNDATLIQSKLDSTAYRDIFNGTKLAKDSASVAEFNKIAASLRGYGSNEDYFRKKATIKERLINQGITTKEFYKLEDTFPLYSIFSTYEINKLQHKADDWAYRKFFTQKGIMTDELSKQCDEVSKKIRP